MMSEERSKALRHADAIEAQLERCGGILQPSFLEELQGAVSALRRLVEDFLRLDMAHILDGIKTAEKITALQAELVAEAARTAEQKLRADQMTRQHAAQARMNSEARQALAAHAGLMPLSAGQVMQCWEKATGEQPERMPPGWLKFAREIEASQGRDTSKLPWCEALESSDIKIQGWPKL